MSRSPFPGMDPYLGHPALWPDVHNRLIAAVADDLTPLVAPRYFIALERRTFLLKPDDIVFIGRPDIAVVGPRQLKPVAALRAAGSIVAIDVEVPMSDEVNETFLEIHEVATGRLVTVLELLSPANKLQPKGRGEYETKRGDIFRTRTNLVEIDLLRAGEPMPVVGPQITSDYRILVSRGATRPHATLFAFSLREPIPAFPLPLLPGDEEPMVNLGDILRAMYTRARFDLGLGYSQPQVPPLSRAETTWARKFIASAGSES